MRSVIRYRSKLLFRKSYRPVRILRVRPVKKITIVFRPARANPPPEAA